MHVGKQEALDNRHSRKADAHRLAYDAVCAVGTDDPSGPQLCAFVAEGDGHPCRIGFELGYSPTPLDRSAKGRKTFAQCAFYLGLGHDQSGAAAKAFHGQPDLQPGQLTSFDGDDDFADGKCTLRQVAQRAETVEDLDPPRLQAERPRRHCRTVGLIEHPHADAGRPQPAREGQARRSRSHHDDVVPQRLLD